jgi:hypothetical protein
MPPDHTRSMPRPARLREGLTRSVPASGLVLALGLCVLAACGEGGPTGSSAVPSWQPLVALPEPIANNAVAAVADASGCTLYTALGVDATRQRTGIHSRAYAWREGESAWRPLPPVPGLPRIAASGVSLRGKFWVLGGYSIAPDDSETSHTELVVYDPASDAWSSASPLPVPIDDAVVEVWRDRYNIVVSGWSNVRPVANVQIYDADNDTWSAGTDFPGTPVFGQAGGLVGDEIYLIDGVGIVNRRFALVNQIWRGTLDPNNPTSIQWISLGTHQGRARYRAAGGTAFGRLLFVGGTDDPYNYDGLSYDSGEPSPPLASQLDINPRTGTSSVVEARPQATMDHRALVGCGGAVYTLGGMTAGPEVVSSVFRLR